MTRIFEIGKIDGSQRMLLPINPAGVSVSMGQKHQTLDLLNMGEVLSPGNRALASLTISSFFPSVRSPFCKYTSRQPWDAFNLLDNWRLGNEVLRLIIGATSINMAVMVQTITPTMREGDQDLNYSLELKEYRQLNVPAVQHSNVQLLNGLLERPNSSTRPAYHDVRSADETFWYIACRYYGDGTQWKRIASHNGRELAYDVRVGDRVRLP